MAIQIDPHTLERAEERGTNENGFSIPAEYGEREKPGYMILGRNDTINTTNKRGSKYSILLKKIT